MSLVLDLQPGTLLDTETLVTLLTMADPGPLYRLADEVRRSYCGDEVFLRGIIEISNLCSRNCFYCGINVHNRYLQRYSMSSDEILAAAREIKAAGVGTVVIQGGENRVYSPGEVADLVAALKELDLAITLSLGEKSEADYRLWREAGADRYLLKFETSDPWLYRRLHPGHRVEERFECLHSLRAVGYQVGSGFMVGLPGQNPGLLARDILALAELQPDMAGIGPFLPHPETPLKGSAPGSPELTLRVLAITRILLPRTHLPATTALYSAEKESRPQALTCGANVIMPNFTPLKYRRLYEIYPAKAEATDPPARVLEQITRELATIGRQISHERGDSLLSAGMGEITHT